MKYISVINTFYPSLSKQEKKVANFVKQEKETISIMSLQEISKKILVSEATIVRFVKKIGFKGFIDFKLEIAKENYNVEKEENNVDYIDNIYINIEKILLSTKGLINKSDVEQAIDLITKSEKMYVFGLGASGVAAMEMQHRFMRYGKIGNYVNVNHFQVMYASTVGTKDLIVAISLSGETQDLLYPLNIAKANGCKIIGITNYILSPLAKLSDIVLLTAAKETPLDGGSLISKISQLYVIDVLATGYALNNKKQAVETRQKIAQAIANKNKE